MVGVILQCRIKTVISLNNQTNGGYERDRKVHKNWKERARQDGVMLVTETLRHRKNFSIILD
jgi:hypothetical protein